MSVEPPIHLENRTQEGARKYSPSAARNRGPIAEAILPLIAPSARILEIASGTGEHALHMCQLRPDVMWQPSDPDDASRASQDSWAQESGGNMLASLNLDVTVKGWGEPLRGCDVIYCANMIHIAPWSAAEGLVSGAADILQSGQDIILYGPFKQGTQTAAGNLDFDRSLKSRNSEWGVRDLEDVKHIFELHGFNISQQTDMPKNNMILVFKRT